MANHYDLVILGGGGLRRRYRSGPPQFAYAHYKCRSAYRRHLRQQLETVAAREGKIAVENAFADAGKTLDLQSVPYAVFTDPEVASVGLTEARYMALHGACSCRTVSLDRVPRAVAVKDTRGLLKMVAHHQTGQVMGVHILAPNASEMIHEAVLAVKHGLTVDDLIDTVHVFPTYSEAIKIAAQAFRRDISTMSCCVE
jgi:mercuric reductase